MPRQACDHLSGTSLATGLTRWATLGGLRATWIHCCHPTLHRIGFTTSSLSRGRRPAFGGPFHLLLRHIPPAEVGAARIVSVALSVLHAYWAMKPFLLGIILLNQCSDFPPFFLPWIGTLRRQRNIFLVAVLLNTAPAKKFLLPCNVPIQNRNFLRGHFFLKSGRRAITHP